MKKPKLIRVTTVPQSLAGLLKGQLKYMAEHDFEVIGISSPGKRLWDVETHRNVTILGLTMTRMISPFKDIKSLWQLYRLFKKEKPDIVHTHTPKAGTLGMIAAFMAGVPLRLHTVAGLPLLEIQGNKRRLLDLIEKITYRCATHVYPNSYGLKEIILHHKFTVKKKLKVIGNGSSNGIDVSEFSPEVVSENQCLRLRRELKISRDDTVFLFVGRVVADKGINELIRAFTLVAKENQKAHLVIVGSHEAQLDPLDPETIERIDQHPHIHAVGTKRNVIPYFAFADVLTFPSYREGFPNVVLQAAAMQRNAIVSDINGCNEIIQNGYNGWIVPKKDVDHLKERMVWCLHHSQESKAMGEKSRKIIIEKYVRQFIWQQLLKEYRTLLIKKKKMAPNRT